MSFSKQQIDALFTYRGDFSPEEKAAFGRINDACKELAQVIRENTPAGADQTCAIRHVVDARMTANKAIVHRGGGLAPQQQ